MQISPYGAIIFLLILTMILFSGCKTAEPVIVEPEIRYVEVEKVVYVPTKVDIGETMWETFKQRPSEEALKDLRYPVTSATDILYNSIIFEQLFEDYREYSLRVLEPYIKSVRIGLLLDDTETESPQPIEATN